MNRCIHEFETMSKIVLFEDMEKTLKGGDMLLLKCKKCNYSKSEVVERVGKTE